MNKPLRASRILNSYYAPVFIIGLMAIFISTVTRLLLLIKSAGGVDWSFGNVAGIFFIGLFYDLVVASYCIIPIMLLTWFTGDKVYAKPWKWVIMPAYVIIIFVLLFTELIPKDFSPELRKGVIGIFMIRLLIFTLLAFAGTKFRYNWRKSVVFLDIFLITFILFFNAISEWFFWDEFSVRYNFIAVDYLVYTTEVLGNIQESYPIGWIIAGVFLLTLIITWTFRKPIIRSVDQRPPFLKRSLVFLAILILPLVSYLFVNNHLRKFSSNEYVNELAGNGLFEFGTAYWNNELDYFKFYQTLPDAEAFGILRKQLQAPNSSFTSNDTFNIERKITYSEPEKHMNVVLISVESLSASFMKVFGDTQRITPYLDSLATVSMFFTNLYSSGTRTVRGLEALSLAIPPTPGQSIVKRPDNGNLFSLGSVFQSKGYTTEYIYGGYGYFDNMNAFFTNNGYTVIDRNAIPPQQIHYANIWGVADEDLLTLALQQMDKNYSQGKPFFSQVMTVSNHRPYTYPEGRVEIPPARQIRQGAVQYTDYAINKFLHEAGSKPWFSNTIFVIVADHCAGSAGSVQLPVTGYHIPMLIYSPGNIPPGNIDKLTAQIDIAPTILGLLKFNYNSKFFGQDIFAIAPGHERAFISTYQGLGYLKDGRLIIQTPVRKLKEFIPDFVTGKATETTVTDSLAKQNIAYYQCASWLFKNKKYNK